MAGEGAHFPFVYFRAIAGEDQAAAGRVLRLMLLMPVVFGMTSALAAADIHANAILNL